MDPNPIYAPLENLNAATRIADRTSVTDVLEDDEIHQIKIDGAEEDGILNVLDDATAEEEEDDELQAQDEVEAVAAVNCK